MKTERKLEINYTIEFEKPDKALKYFTGEFSQYFHEIESLENASEYIASTLLIDNGEIPLYVEGVGDFEKSKPFAHALDQHFFNKDNNIIGKITVEFHGLD